MKPTTYKPEKDFFFASLKKDEIIVCCGKCSSELGTMSRLVIRDEPEMEHRIPQENDYDPVRAEARRKILAKALAKANVVSESGAPYLLLNVGYSQRPDGLVVLNPDGDERSPESRRLRSKAKWIEKQRERVWSQDRELFQGLTLYKFYELEEGQEPHYTEERSAIDERVFHIVGDEKQRAAIYEQLDNSNKEQREQDIRDRRRAEELGEGVAYFDKHLSQTHFLQMQPISTEEPDFLMRCAKCKEDNAIMLKKLAEDFIKWESEKLAKAKRL